jgi:RNA polymerase sigma-70 factor (ECF subfamily)
MYPLAERWLDAMGRTSGEIEVLEARLRAAVEASRLRWPGVSLAEEAFVDHLAALVLPGTDPGEALDAMQLEELYLACACGQGDRAALEAFDQRFSEDLRIAHVRMGGRAPGLEDYLQTIRRKLFAEQPPGILRYAGTGALRSWLRVTAVRVLLDMTRNMASREVATADNRFDAVPAAEDDPELAYLKVSYRHAFREAFEEAATGLSPEARNVLRAHFVHGLGIDEIAATHGIHRATAARRLAKAREDLLRDTRRILLARLSLSRDELASVMRLIESKLHVSMQRLLRTGGAPGA